MHDPDEGLDGDGLIRTGVRADRIPEEFAEIVHAVTNRVAATDASASVFLYGSVATGQATSPGSDVDLLTLGVDPLAARGIAAEMSARFAARCRGVEVAAGSVADANGDTDEAYGNRVFLHHYCVHLVGPDVRTSTAGFAGDRRAARGFNGDIALHLDRWRAAAPMEPSSDLGRRVARKTLLAMAGLVSIHDSTWTTDRQTAVNRWSEIEPSIAESLAMLSEWSNGSTATATRATVQGHLDETIPEIVDRFATDIGLWT